MAKKKAVSSVPPLGASAVFGLAEPPAKKATDYLRSYRSWVYAAVSHIARNVAGIELSLYKKKLTRDGIETEEVFEHPSLSLIHHINKFTTQYQMFELTQIYLELMGEAFWALIRENGNITEVWALRPDWVTIKPSKTDVISHYEYKPYGTGKAVRLERDDVIPFKQVNPENPYRGFGTSKAAAMAIDINDFSDQWQRAFFYNSAMPSIIFSTEQKLNEKTITRFMKSWENKFGGPKKAHQIAFLGGGLKPEFIPSSAKDMDFINLQHWTRDEILAAFKVSKANLGIVEDVNRANQEATDARFQKQVVKPKMYSLATQLTEFLLPLYPGMEDYFFDFKDPVPADVESELKYYENALKYGWMTPNEIREKEGMDAIEGGDEIYRPQIFPSPGQNSPTEGLRGLFRRKKKEAPTVRVKEVKKEVKHNVPIPPTRLAIVQKREEGKQIKETLMPELKRMVAKVMEKQNPEETGLVHWKQMIAKTSEWEMGMLGILDQLFRDQREEVIGKLNGTKSIKSASDIKGWLFNLTVANKTWLAAMIPFLQGFIRDRSAQIMDLLQVDAEIDMGSKTVLDFLRDEVGTKIKGINETTLDKLRKTLADGVEVGEGIPELTSRVKDVFEVANTSRARTIARTEVLRAESFAAHQSYLDSGVVAGLQWYSALDERVRPTHGTGGAHGQVVRLGEKFQVGADHMVEPRMGTLAEENINCRCSAIPLTADEMAALGQERGKKPISVIRKGHGKVKKLESKEKELQVQVDKLTEELKEKYGALKKEVPELREEIAEEIRVEYEDEKDGLLKEIKDLRERAEKIVEGGEQG